MAGVKAGDQMQKNWARDAWPHPFKQAARSSGECSERNHDSGDPTGRQVGRISTSIIIPVTRRVAGHSMGGLKGRQPPLAHPGGMRGGGVGQRDRTKILQRCPTSRGRREPRDPQPGKGGPLRSTRMGCKQIHEYAPFRRKRVRTDTSRRRTG